MSTLAELQVEVAEQIGSINVTDDATKINRYLNRGVRHVLRNTKCFVASTTATPGASANYSLAAGVLEVVDMYFTVGNDAALLTRVSVPEINQMRAYSGSAVGPASYYALAGNNLVMFYPTPAAADVLTMIYVPAPTAMSSASHDPSNATYGGVPEDYHELIALYACWWLAMYDDDASSQNGRDYKALLDIGLNRAKRELAEKGGTVQAGMVRGPLRASRRRRNDVYP